MYSINRVSETITRMVSKLNGVDFCGLKSTGRHSIAVATRLIIILTYLVIIVHVLACIWIWIGVASYLFDNEKPPTWIYNEENGVNQE